MINLNDLDDFRVRTQEVLDMYGSWGDETGGAFMIPHRQTGVTLKVIASAENGWDHVSVSIPHRTPNWQEMQSIHRIFFRPDETVWEYHVAHDKHISLHPFTLHLWRKHHFDMPLPPVEFV